MSTTTILLYLCPRSTRVSSVPTFRYLMHDLFVNTFSLYLSIMKTYKDNNESKTVIKTSSHQRFLKDPNHLSLSLNRFFFFFYSIMKLYSMIQTINKSVWIKIWKDKGMTYDFDSGELTEKVVSEKRKLNGTKADNISTAMMDVLVMSLSAHNTGNNRWR